ncbi:hypothetical protein [endosymbiont DhMRE of Dentiscutata heterogama]|uniref:hypothetical protein n=1 Tax=endosymbiont DhMRE of Dentiscutata heterogama TaxID=1609546 RepID=UPI002AD4322F|nr:hypothetical protein [endosymbiont DhMRE of Dentiscutata heterogama]
MEKDLKRWEEIIDRKVDEKIKMIGQDLSWIDTECLVKELNRRKKAGELKIVLAGNLEFEVIETCQKIK